MTQAHQGVTLNHLIVSALRRFGDRPAFEHDGQTTTYGQAGDLVARLRTVFEQRGIGKGDGVAVLSPNRPEAFLVEAAAWLAGARCTPLPGLASEADQRAICEMAQTRVLIADPVFAQRAGSIATASDAVDVVLGLGPSAELSDLLDAARATAPARGALDPTGVDEEDLLGVWLTGGTTGLPKGVMLSHRAMVQSVYGGFSSAELPAHPRYLAASPITHVALLPVVPTLLRGGTVILHTSFEPRRWLDAIASDRVTLALAVPTMIYAVLSQTDPEAVDLSTLETVLYGASPMSPAKLVEAHTRIGPVFTQLYGQIEVPGGIATLLKGEQDPAGDPERLRSCGRPVVGADVRVLDGDGNPVGPGEIGEVCVRSRGVMNGYWNDEDATAEIWRGGWHHTTDLATFDDDGFLYIVDRAKDMIITGGFNVYPRQIEDVLTSHPDVASAAVFGIPDPHWGEAVHAAVTAVAGRSPDPAELIARVKEAKGSHYAPKSLDIVEALPLTPVGKIDKKTLRAPYWEGQTRSVG